MTVAGPSVAIVVPCYNQFAYLHDAVASARAQTYAHVEIVVVDDGSTAAEADAALGALERAGVQIVRQANAGLAAARNAGVRATNAPFFVPLDADDRLAPRFVERLLPRLLANERVAYAYGDTRLFGVRERDERSHDFDPRRLLLTNLCTATALVRRSAFDAAGGYDPTLRGGYEDWDFWLRLVEAGFRGERVREVLFHYRQHASSMRLDAERRHAELTRALIARHRPLYARLLGLDRTARGERCASDEAIFEQLQAAVAVDALERAGSWRRLRSLGLAPATPADVPPTQQLAVLRSSHAFRLLARIKRTPLHQAYAAWRWG